MAKDETQAEAGRERPAYATDAELRDRQRRFTYHPPRPELRQLERYADLRHQALLLALTIATDVPPGREKALAFTQLEQAVMWANAGIARGESADM